MEYERLKKIEGKKILKKLHSIKCPKSGMEFIALDYKKIEVD